MKSWRGKWVEGHGRTVAMAVVVHGLCFSAWAVVDASSGANTNAPADGSPWNSVGSIMGASGVYVGAGWVLTASHVGAGNTGLGGVLYPWDGTWLQLTNADGSFTDLVMFRLATLPPLPRMPLAATTPAASSQVDLIAHGHIAGSSETNFGSLTGFYLSDYPYKSWGNNRVNAGGTSVINAGYGKITIFSTTFSSPPSQTSDEAQGVAGDSGGGVFQLSGSTWRLVGMINAVSTQPNQPANTAVYGDSTAMADIATYRAQIAAVVAAAVPTLSISRAGTNAMVCWPDTGVTFSLFGSHTLAPPGWTRLSPSLTLTNGQFCALVPTTNSPTFFRLQQ